MNGVLVTLIICATFLVIALLLFVFSEGGTIALRRTINAIKAEKLKAKDKELLAGKYIG